MDSLKVKNLIIMGVISTSLVLTTASCGNYKDTTSINVETTVTEEVIDENQIREDESLEYFKKQLVENGNLDNNDLDEKWKYKHFRNNKLKNLFAYVDNEILKNEEYTSNLELLDSSNYGNFSFKKIETDGSCISFYNTNRNKIIFNTDSYGHIYYVYDAISDSQETLLLYTPYTNTLEISKRPCQLISFWYDETYTIPNNKNINMMEQILRLYNQNIDSKDIIDNKDTIVKGEYAIIDAKEITEASNDNSNQEVIIIDSSDSEDLDISETIEIVESCDETLEISTNEISKQNLDINRPYNKFISIIDESNIYNNEFDKEEINNIVNDFNPCSEELRKALPYLINATLYSKKHYNLAFPDKYDIHLDGYFNAKYANDDRSVIISTGKDFDCVTLINNDNNNIFEISYFSLEDTEKNFYTFDIKNVDGSIYYDPIYNEIYKYGEEGFKYIIPSEMNDIMINQLFMDYKNDATYSDVLSHITDISNGINPSLEKVYSINTK